MASIKELAIGTSNLFKMDPRSITVDPNYNVRVFDSARDEEDAFLKASIKANGVKTPLTIRLEGDIIVLAAGHRRLAATMELIAEGHEIVSVPAVNEGKGTTEQDRVADLIISNSGKPLSQTEKAEVFKRLIAFGWTELMIAERIGFSIKQVQNLLVLSGADPIVKELISTGVVSSTQAILTMKAEGSEAAKVLTEAAAASPNGRVTAKNLRPTPAPVVTLAALAGVAETEVEEDLTPIPTTLGGLLGSFGTFAPPTQTMSPVEKVEMTTDEGGRRDPAHPKLVLTPAKIAEAIEVLREIMVLTDVKTIQIMVHDFFNIRQTSAPKAA